MYQHASIARAYCRHYQLDIAQTNVRTTVLLTRTVTNQHVVHEASTSRTAA